MTRKLFVEDILREVITMNNENELHDVTFKIRYPNKKEKTAYAVKSILIYELTILAENIIIAAIICSFFLNEWSISQKCYVFMAFLCTMFFASQIFVLLKALLGKYSLKRFYVSETDWREEK